MSRAMHRSRSTSPGPGTRNERNAAERQRWPRASSPRRAHCGLPRPIAVGTHRGATGRMMPPRCGTRKVMPMTRRNQARRRRNNRTWCMQQHRLQRQAGRKSFVRALVTAANRYRDTVAITKKSKNFRSSFVIRSSFDIGALTVPRGSTRGTDVSQRRIHAEAERRLIRKNDG